MPTDYGLDFSTFVGEDGIPDLDPTFTVIPGTSTRAIAECLARGLYMPHGRLVEIGDEQDCGFDVRAFLSGKIATRELASIKRGVESEALRDERVDTVTADVTYHPDGNRIEIVVEGDGAVGPFEFVLSITQLTVELLNPTT